MRRILSLAVLLAALTAGGHAFAGSRPGIWDDSSTQGASPQADESKQYQDCSQGNEPLFSDFPPPSTSDLFTYMHYTVVKKGQFNDILAWGEIDPCDEPRLREVLREAKPVGTIELISPGGELHAAMAMGRTIRSYGVPTYVGGKDFCISACNFLYMGGMIRTMDPGADFEVHMFDDNAADDLRKETANPPTDLLDFLELFPFRTDVTMQSVDDAVKQRNDDNAAAVAALQKLTQAELAQLGGQPSASPAASGGNTSSSATDSASDTESSVDNYCASQVAASISDNATLAQEAAYHKECLAILDQPYTEADWFRDEATTEYVKKIQQDGAQTAAMIARYLSEMSISLRFLTDFANIPNAHPQPLTIDELRDLNVVNSD
jgi:hypothetical protein